jgi:hypothetical protein
VFYFISFFVLLAFLFLISKALLAQLGLFIFKLTGGNREWTVGIMAFLFIPGTAVHEFAHASVAQMLGVHVGEIDLMPKIEGKHIKLGTVQVQDTDPFRRFLIGIAPIFVGLTLIFIVLFIYQRFGEDWPWWAVLLVYYAVFQVGNGMFSSRRDMEGAIELGIALLLVSGILYLFGVRFSLGWAQNFIINSKDFFQFASGAILKIVILDLVVVGIAAILNKLFQRRVNLYN